MLYRTYKELIALLYGMSQRKSRKVTVNFYLFDWKISFLE